MSGNRIGKFLTMTVVLVMVLVSYLPLASAEGPIAEIEFLRAEVDIDNSYAITEVTAKLNNPSDQAIDETFAFEVPDDAFITNFSLTVKGVTYYADIMKKDEAEQRYEEAKKAGNNAGIMASRGKSTFTYGVSIAANDSVTVTLRYEDFIERTVDGYMYELALDSYGGRTIGSFSIDVRMGYDRAITDLRAETYVNGTFFTVARANMSAKASYTAQDFKATDNFILRWDLAKTSVNGYMLFYERPGSEEGYFFHVFNPTVEDLGGYLPKDIVFVLDKSGSMSGRKMDQLKDAFGKVVMDLRAEDRFEIVTFSSDVGTSYDKLIDASYTNTVEARHDIDSIEAGGGTNINEALLTGLEILDTTEERVPIIVFLTDGRATSGVTSTTKIRENVRAANEAGVAIYCLGFGENVDFDFLKALALENDGIAIKIYEESDASDQITDFYDTISLPLLRDVDLSYGEGTSEVYPTHVDNLYEGSEIVISGRYNRSLTSITFKATAMSSAGQRAFSDTFAVATTGYHDFIERYWAYSKIRYLMDQMAIADNVTVLEEEVTDISLDYGFVTPYTSLFVEVPKDDVFTPDPTARPVARGYEGDTSGNYAADKTSPAYPPRAGGKESNIPGFELALLAPALAIAAVLIGRRSRKE
jgi:uncharacterized protein YegL